MTTTVRITNHSSHGVAVVREQFAHADGSWHYGEDFRQVLHPGEDLTTHVWTDRRIVVEEAVPFPEE